MAILHHFMAKARWEKAGYDRKAHCGFKDNHNPLRPYVRTWILECPGIPALRQEDACPCCLNIVHEGMVEWIESL